MFTPEGLGEPWRERLDGAVMRVPGDHATGGEIVVRGIEHPHSLLDVDGDLWLCESRRRRVLRFAGWRPDAREVVAELPAYTRGLCLARDWIAVGQSRSDAHFVKPLVEGAPAKPDAACGIWLIPRGGGERRFIELPAMEVYDILRWDN
jgi:hypothetical protein